MLIFLLGFRDFDGSRCGPPVGSGAFQKLSVLVGSVQEMLEVSCGGGGLGGVGEGGRDSSVFWLKKQSSNLRNKRFTSADRRAKPTPILTMNLTGRVGSNQEGFKYHGSGQVGSGNPDPTRPTRRNPTRDTP